jgi:hypothetical protein
MSMSCSFVSEGIPCCDGGRHSGVPVISGEDLVVRVWRYTLDARGVHAQHGDDHCGISAYTDGTPVLTCDIHTVDKGTPVF